MNKNASKTTAENTDQSSFHATLTVHHENGSITRKEYDVLMNCVALKKNDTLIRFA